VLDIEIERRIMGAIQDIWYGAADLPGHTWQWFNTLNREEWMVVLLTVCACGFVALLGFGARRL
jgi:hypothetical protein